MSKEYTWSDELVEDILMGVISSRTAAKMAIAEFKNDARYRQPKQEWEILEFDYGIIFREHDDSYWSRGAWVNYNLSKNRKIRKVKRLSDGEVFSVGDEVCFQKQSNPNWVIDNFFVKENTILARSNSCDHCEYVDKDLVKIITDENGIDALNWWQQLLPEIQKQLRRKHKVSLPHSITTSDIKNIYNSEHTLSKPKEEQENVLLKSEWNTNSYPKKEDEISGFQVWYKNGRKSTFITRDEKDLFERLEGEVNKKEELKEPERTKIVYGISEAHYDRSAYEFWTDKPIDLSKHKYAIKQAIEKILNNE